MDGWMDGKAQAGWMHGWICVRAARPPADAPHARMLTRRPSSPTGRQVAHPVAPWPVAAADQPGQSQAAHPRTDDRGVGAGYSDHAAHPVAPGPSSGSRRRGRELWLTAPPPPHLAEALAALRIPRPQPLPPGGGAAATQRAHETLPEGSAEARLRINRRVRLVGYTDVVLMRVLRSCGTNTGEMSGAPTDRMRARRSGGRVRVAAVRRAAAAPLTCRYGARAGRGRGIRDRRRERPLRSNSDRVHDGPAPAAGSVVAIV